MSNTKNYILAIDQGTTFSKAVLFNVEDFSILSQASCGFKQIYPKSSWVEHNLNDIFLSIRKSCKDCLEFAYQKQSSFNANDISCIGLTNQRETLAVYDSKTNDSLCNAIVWQCKRSLDICSDLKKSNQEDYIQKKTGLLIDPYFTGTKISWLLANNHLLAQKIKSNNKRLRLSTIDSYVLSRLTSGVSFYTEPSNASRTLMYSLSGDSWDDELIELFGLKSCDCLAEIIDSNSLFGKTKGLDFLPDGIPITGILGDQQASSLAQGCINLHAAKCSYGTGAFLLLNTGHGYSIDQTKSLLSTVGWSIDGKKTYMLEGASFIAGAGMDFVQKNLGLFNNISELSDLEHIKAAPEIYFVPALSGLGAPHWHPSAKAALFGLSRDTDKNKVIVAMLEGVALSVADLIKCAENISVCPEYISVDGGMSNNQMLLQFQADICNIKVYLSQTPQGTALGAAIMAAYGCKIITSLDISKYFDNKTVYKPNMDNVNRQKIFSGWSKAIEAVKIFS